MITMVIFTNSDDSFSLLSFTLFLVFLKVKHEKKNYQVNWCYFSFLRDHIVGTCIDYISKITAKGRGTGFAWVERRL